jgi:hypothetical protein
VGVYNVDILQIQALQWGPKAFDNVLAGQAVVVDEDFTICTAWEEMEG